MIRVGVVGVGGWGKNHLRVLSELGLLSGFCDTDLSKLDLYKKMYSVEGYSSVDELLSKAALDAVIVSTPTATHYAVAEKIINAGIAVFVEKPLSCTTIEGKKLVELAEVKDVLMTVGYIERFNPAIKKIKDMLDKEELGDPRLLEFRRENKLNKRIVDVGAIMDTSVHDIDTARWLFNSNPNVVFARTGRMGGEHEDFAAITLGFKGGKTAILTSNWVTSRRIRKLSGVFTKCAIDLDFITQDVKVDMNDETLSPEIVWQEPLVLELSSFVDCVSSGKKPLITSRDALHTTEVAEAALVSNDTGSAIYLEL